MSHHGLFFPKSHFLLHCLLNAISLRIPWEWGIQGKRTTPGVQQYISYLCSMLTLEEAAETFRRLLPLGMSARQALYLMNPVGKALAEREDEVVKALFEE